MGRPSARSSVEDVFDATASDDDYASVNFKVNEISDASLVHEIHVDAESRLARNFHVCDINGGQVHICNDKDGGETQTGTETPKSTPIFTLSVGRRDKYDGDSTSKLSDALKLRENFWKREAGGEI